MNVVELESGIICKKHTDQLLKLNIEKIEEEVDIIIDETKITQTTEGTEQAEISERKDITLFENIEENEKEVEVRSSNKIKKPTIKLNL